MEFVIEKIGNMVFAVADGETIFKAWHSDDFTKRKLANFKRKMQVYYCGNVSFDERI